MLIDIKLPDLGFKDAEVVDILVKEEDLINSNQAIILVEGDKASMEIPSEFSGKVKSIKVNIGDKLNFGSLIMVLSSIDNDSKLIKETLINKNIIDDTNIINQEVHATPFIRKLARSLDIDLSKIQGSGRNSRILHEDLKDYININKKNKNSDCQSLFNEEFKKFGNIEIVKLKKIKVISGRNLYNSWNNIPHVTQFENIDITNLEKFRNEYDYSILGYKSKISILVFFIKTISYALEKFPEFNSSLTSDGKELILKKYINIGIAVNTENGLLVPVLKNANKKSISTISNELINLYEKARNGNINISELKGGCFTISNLGRLVNSYFTPIINFPEVAILGISNANYQPVWNGIKFIPKLIIPVSLSYDHRVIDGIACAHFINFIKTLISNISCLII